jgi:hypothetical protein
MLALNRFAFSCSRGPASGWHAAVLRASSGLVALTALGVGSLGALGACSSSSATGTGGSAATTSSSHSGTGAGSTSSSGVTTGSSSSGGTGGTAMTCPPAMKYGGGETPVVGTKTVTAKVVDETGAPVTAGQPVYICGIDKCSPATQTAADGTVTISTTDTMTKPAFKVGDATSYAEIAIPLTGPTLDLTAGGTKVISTAKLADAAGVALTPGSSATSGDVTLAIPAGASVTIDQLIYSTPALEQFHAVSIPLANEGPWLAASGHSDFGLLYGVTPAETLLCPAAQVTVALPHKTTTPNDLGWAANAPVEFWVMTIDTGETYAPYAGWAKISDGTVSADGTKVSTDATGGFIFLQTFAVRLKS